MVKVAGVKVSVPSVSMPQTTGEWKRTVLWMTWTLNLLLDAVYMVRELAFSQHLSDDCNFAWLDVWQSYYKLYVSGGGVPGVVTQKSAWRAPVASTVLGGLMVLTFNIMSCAILIRKSINRSGPGFGYGFIMAWCFVMAFYLFLCGLVTSGFYPVVTKELEPLTGWSKIDTGAYNGTTAFSFICAAFFMVFFLCLVIFQGGIMKQTGLYDPRQDEKRKMEMAMMQAAQMGANPMAHQAGQAI